MSYIDLLMPTLHDVSAHLFLARGLKAWWEFIDCWYAELVILD